MTSLPAANTFPDFEPDQRWRADLRQRIEVGLSSMVERAKKDYSTKRIDPSLDKSTVDDDYHKVMHGIRRIAEEQYQLAVERERQERRWASGQFIDQEWSEVMIKEQQAILDNIKREGPSLLSRNEQPAGVPTRAATEQIARERARKPSSGFPDSTEDLRPPRSSAENREPFPLSSTLSRWRNDERVRARSGSMGSPSQVKPEIWVPAGGSKEGGTSRTFLHAAGTFSTKPRRGSSASIGIVNSGPATTSERSQTPNSGFTDGRERVGVQENEQTWSGTTRSRQTARRGFAGIEDKVSLDQHIGETQRGDEYAITSSLVTSIGTPVSPFDGARHATSITTNRPPISIHQAQTPLHSRLGYSEPKPTKNKRSIRDGDSGYAFRPSPGSGGWEKRGFPIDKNRIYASVSSSSQDDIARSWEPSSLKSKYKNAAGETYPADTESESDSDNELEWRQRLEDEFSRRESDVKSMEAAVLRKREEARRKELELKQREEELKRKEEEFLQREEEVKRKEEEVRLKEQELRKKEKEWLEKEAEAKKKGRGSGSTFASQLRFGR